MDRRRSNRFKCILVEPLERRELLAADLGLFTAQPEPPPLRSSPIDSSVSSLDSPTRGAGTGELWNGPKSGKDPRQEPEFPSLDGSGNNLEHPEFGNAGQAFDRWVAEEYADGLSEPAGQSWPGARDISNIMSATPGSRENTRGLSDLSWLFGQFIDHDITLSAAGHEEAMNIAIPAGDPFFDPFNTGQKTMEFMRSGYIFDESSVRQQVNKISAFIDGSVIYGSDATRADALRTLEGGRLKTSQGDLLPFNEPGLDNAGGPSPTMFLAGDIRANENAALSAMHTVWVREHNRVADEIEKRNPDLLDSDIYLLARRFVVGELQAITYHEFLPALLGDKAIGKYKGYDPTVDPDISNIFATAAYRFGHTMLSSELLRLNADGTTADAGNLPLQQAFFNPNELIENGIDSLLLGASVQIAQEVDPFLVDDVRNFLFGPPGSGGFDLAALNIQRGRDHGLGNYNQVRIDMGLKPVESFAEISSSPEIQSRLRMAYDSVDHIDAWVGMLAEDHVADSTLGNCAKTIIAKQFQRLRDGDRFYYENVFTGDELREIEKTTLADVIGRNTNIRFSKEQNVFYAKDIKHSGKGHSDNDAGSQNPVDDFPVFQAPPPARIHDTAIRSLTDEELRRRY